VRIKGVLRSKDWVRQIDIELESPNPYDIVLGEQGVTVEVNSEKNKKRPKTNKRASFFLKAVVVDAERA